MKKILFLGDSTETCEFLECAKKEGFHTIVTDYNDPKYSTAKLLADEYWMVSTADLDTLEQKCKDENIQAVISGASDFNIEMMIKLCERLNLPCYCNEEVWNNTKDKILFKKICRESGVLVPEDYEVSSILSYEELQEVKFPVMVKPVNLNANIGVSYCYNLNDLIAAYRYAESLSLHQDDKIIVERMLSGIEFFCYYVLAEGEASFLTIGIRLPQPNEPKFCYSMNTTINSFTDRYLREVNSSMIEVLKKLGCREGIACVQCMLDEDNHFYAFEMCYSAEASLLLAPLRYVYDFDAIKWQFECAIGKKHFVNQLPHINRSSNDRCANSYILFSNKDGIISEINGIETIKQIPNVTCTIHVHEGDKAKKFYPLGHIMFDTDNCEQICEIIKLINTNVSIKNSLGEDLIIHYDDSDFIINEYQRSIKYL